MKITDFKSDYPWGDDSAVAVWLDDGSAWFALMSCEDAREFEGEIIESRMGKNYSEQDLIDQGFVKRKSEIHSRDFMESGL